MKENKSSRVAVDSLSPKILKSTVEEIRIPFAHLFNKSLPEGRKEGTCLFDINTKHNTEIYIGKIISGDSH